MTTDTKSTTRTATCPSWCVHDVAPEDIVDGVQQGGDTVLHMAADVSGETLEGRWDVGISQDGTAPATLDGYAHGQMTPQQARAFAAAIVAACDVIEGTPSTAD